MASADRAPRPVADEHSDLPAPKVSIGMPVYNGQEYVAEAIRSVLEQTFEDLELVISDDGSSDRTESICREFAREDPRVRYYRNPRNMGCMWNWNRVFELSRGEYFKWAAQDDLLRPTYLERCIAVLDRDPGAAACHSLTQVLHDGQETLMRVLEGLDEDRPSSRFAAVVLRPHWTIEMHGLLRAEVMRRTFLMPPYFGADKALMAEVALIGRIARVKEALFVNRDHSGRTMRAITFAGRLRFHDPDGTGRRILPQWALYKDYLRAIRRQVQDPIERLRCYSTLALWWFVNWNTLRMAIDVAAAVAPRTSNWAFQMRESHHGRGIGSG